MSDPGGRVVERRHHPDYDRVTFRRAMRGFAISGLSFLGGFVAGELGAGKDWLIWPMFAGFLAGVVVILRTPINRYPCPTCGQRLSRPPEPTEFPCEQCGVVWETRSWGYNVFE